MEVSVTEKELEILCVGIANFSVLIKPVNREIFDVDVTLVDPVEVSLGGDALNESMTAALLGNRVGLISKIGNDFFGKFMLDSVAKAGVVTDYMIVSDSEKTATAAMLINGNGDRNVCANRGAFETLSLEDIDISVFERAKIVNIGSMFALKKLDGDGVKAILERARNAGAITGSDMKFDTYKLGFNGIKQVFPYIDYFFPNYEEALYLTSEREPSRQCDALIDAGCGNVIVKLGSEGCFLAANGKKKIIPPCPTRCVDTSGAGDNFVAGFLTGLNRGWGPEESARFGNATAAVSIQEVGSNGTVRSFGQIVEYMSKVNYS